MLDYIKRHLFWIVPTLFFAGLGLVFYYHTAIPSWLGYTGNIDVKDKIELLGSIIVGWGALFGISIAAWRNRELNRQATAAEKQQASEQLVEAIKLLARSSQEGTPLIEARIGALYNLEALASTHPMDYSAQVMKTIAAYICENAQKTARDKPGEPNKRTEPSPLGKDVQTAFAVLKRLYDKYALKLIEKEKLRRYQYDVPNILDDIDFSKADLRKLDLSGVEWIGQPTLEKAQLQGSNLEGAELQSANLQGADLQDANLSEIKAQGILLKEADLRGANLQHAELEGAILKFARSPGADLYGAQLDCSDWHNVDVKISEKELTQQELIQFLQKGEWNEKTIERIFNVGEHGLWQPQSAHIFCDANFTPLTYEHNDTEQLDPNDTQYDWKALWRQALHNVPKEIYRTIVEHLIKIHRAEQSNSPCVKGLRQLPKNKKTPWKEFLALKPFCRYHR